MKNKSATFKEINHIWYIEGRNLMWVKEVYLNLSYIGIYYMYHVWIINDFEKNIITKGNLDKCFTFLNVYFCMNNVICGKPNATT